MKLKYLLILFLLPILLISSCKREEDRIFDTNATVRITEAVQNAYTVLQGNKAGWMMKFYPSKNQEFGGYTIFTKFISNEKVSIASDPIAGVETSSYAVVAESGPVLTFNGYNKSIHWFSEPGMDNGGVVGDGGIGPDDSGMQGDFEFIVLKATADSVVLKGKKTGSHLVMLPLKNEEFESLSKTYQEATNKFNQFLVYKLETPGSEVVNLDFDPRYRVFSNPNDQATGTMSFRVIPGALEFYKEYIIEGKSFDRLNYVQPTSAYPNGYYTDKSNAIKIVPATAPLNIWFRNNLWSMSYSNTGPTGKIYWDRAKTALKTNGIVVNNAFIGKLTSNVGLIYVLQNGAVVGGVSHFIDPVKGTEDQIYIELEGYVIGNFPIAYWTGGINNITTPFNGRTFKITSDGTPNPTALTLTDIGIPTNTYKVFLKDINDPFNN
ncbi:MULTISPECIES: DUF4302 domain-containing protein [unclassified Sphingobacterium]|uniref:DUF4302 domain-containing protein n=1 Tax=unclassified Sphingobacterium TaxID=2609468 RepID=UPI00105023C8|nr:MULTISPECIES: DUF4302 domain-containing protein [unclassified Sphingobacterium]MCS3553162.1 hypothetical protein [Sphingobacterium sp. JUb21]TCR09628.1 uncharacterized protein DUF4302 [Sphingobacterium sp. JUb20]